MNKQQEILIVDDTPVNLRLLSQMLLQEGYQVRAARNGPRAIESARAAPPALILLDIVMPEMDGFQVCAHLKQDDRTSDVPILFLSAQDALESKVQAFAAGGVDFITKPFQPEEVLARVRTHLSLRNLQHNLESKVLEQERTATLLRIERDLAIALGATHNEIKAIQYILDALLQIPGIDCGLVYVVDNAWTTAGSGGLDMVSFQGISPRSIRSIIRFEADDPYTKRIKDAVPIYTHCDSDTVSCADLFQTAGFRARAIVPALYNGKVVASFDLASRSQDTWSKSTRNAIESITSQIGGVIARVRAEETLRQYAADLKAQNAELDAFAHTVAHDLKNPMANAIMGIDILHKLIPASCKTQEVDQTLQDMNATTRQMINIVDELLLLASVRQENVVRTPLEMGDLIRQAQKRIRWMSDLYGAQIEVPDSWPTAIGYGPWIVEAWVNYMSNGLKYGGRPPHLTLGATRLQEGWIRFWVRDNGPGLTEQEQEKLFTPFSRLHKVRAQGQGLGLSIVRRIIEKLGGQVGVESQPGQGSMFFFSLPDAR